MIWPSQLTTPYSLNTANYLAETLAQNGVGIFISDDNLTTVINVVTGQSGTAADITNNERAEQSGNFRIGYDYSSLTALEQAELDADPYQVFAHTSAGIIDYGLKLTTASETVTLPLVGAYDVTVTYADDTTENYTGSGSLVLDGTTPVHIKHIKGTDSEGNVYFDGNNDANTTNLPELIQGKHGVLSGFPVPSGYVRDANGVIEGYRTASQLFNLTSPVLIQDGFSFKCKIKHEFLKNWHTYFGSYYGGDSGEAWSYSDGRIGWRPNQNVNDRVITPVGSISINTDHTLEFVVEGGFARIYVDGVLQNLNNNSLSVLGHVSIDYIFGGSNNSPMDGLIYYAEIAQNDETIHYWDFTTGDADQIIDTVGGNHATIVNVPTSGYLPVVERQVFTQDDYLNLSSLATAEASNSYQSEYRGATSVGATINGFSDGLRIIDSTITSAITSTISGQLYVDNSTLDNIDVSGATGDTFIVNSEVNDVTG